MKQGFGGTVGVYVWCWGAVNAIVYAMQNAWSVDFKGGPVLTTITPRVYTYTHIHKYTYLHMHAYTNIYTHIYIAMSIYDENLILYGLPC